MPAETIGLNEEIDTLRQVLLVSYVPSAALSKSQPPPNGTATTANANAADRIHLIVDDLASKMPRLQAAGARFRNEMVSGPDGPQVLLIDPSGNLVELFQPAQR